MSTDFPRIPMTKTPGTCVLHFSESADGKSTDVLMAMIYPSAISGADFYVGFGGAADGAFAGAVFTDPASFLNLMNAFMAATCTSSTTQNGTYTSCSNLNNPPHMTIGGISSYFTLKIVEDATALTQFVQFRGVATSALTCIFGPGLDTLPSSEAGNGPIFTTFWSSKPDAYGLTLNVTIGTPGTNAGSGTSSSSMKWIIIAVAVVVVLFVLVKLFHGHGSQKKSSSSLWVPPPRQPSQYWEAPRSQQMYNAPWTTPGQWPITQQSYATSGALPVTQQSYLTPVQGPVIQQTYMPQAPTTQQAYITQGQGPITQQSYISPGQVTQM